MRAQIRKAINNLYDAWQEDEKKLYRLRIKGKVLKLDEFEYNPLAVGDYVEFFLSARATFADPPRRRLSLESWWIGRA